MYAHGNFSTTSDRDLPIPPLLKAISLVIILPLCQMSEYLQPPVNPQSLFYGLSFVKFAAIIYGIVAYNALIFKYTDRGVETIRTTVKLD